LDWISRIRETLTERLIRELTNGQLDTTIVALPVSKPSVDEVALFEEKFPFVRPEIQSALPAPSNKTPQNERLLLLEEGRCFRDQALSFYSISRQKTSGGLDGSSLATLVHMVAPGIGVTVIPEMAVDVETRSAAVSVVRFEGLSKLPR
jgi:LysR family hydrogen peroxide-inducible transcriptional activator